MAQNKQIISKQNLSQPILFNQKNAQLHLRTRIIGTKPSQMRTKTLTKYLMMKNRLRHQNQEFKTQLNLSNCQILIQYAISQIYKKEKQMKREFNKKNQQQKMLASENQFQKQNANQADNNNFESYSEEKIYQKMKHSDKMKIFKIVPGYNESETSKINKTAKKCKSKLIQKQTSQKRSLTSKPFISLQNFHQKQQSIMKTPKKKQKKNKIHKHKTNYKLIFDLDSYFTKLQNLKDSLLENDMGNNNSLQNSSNDNLMLINISYLQSLSEYEMYSEIENSQSKQLSHHQIDNIILQPLMQNIELQKNELQHLAVNTFSSTPKSEQKYQTNNNEKMTKSDRSILSPNSNFYLCKKQNHNKDPQKFTFEINQ